jgi:Na+/proline symporter
MRDERTVRQAIAISIGFQFIIGASVVVLGMLMRVLFPNISSPDQASSIMASRVLAPLAGSLLLVAMMSAIMSNCNSILLVTGAGFAHDIYGRFIRPGSSQRHLVLVNRLSIFVLCLLPAYFALQKYNDVMSIVVQQAKLVASFFFVPVVIGLNWRRGTGPAAIAAMIGGFVTCIAWQVTLQRRTGLAAIDSVEVAILVSLALFIMVSRLTNPTPEANLRIFFN